MLGKPLRSLVCLALSVLFAGCGQGRIDSNLGPAPHFTWIKDGDARPAPRIMRLMGPFGDRTSAIQSCHDPADAPACLLRNWRTYLAALGQTELGAARVQRSYRALIEPACNGEIVVRLDVDANGQGIVRTTQAQVAPPRAALAKSPITPAESLWTRTAAASAQDVASVTHALRANWFDFITADPSALLIRGEAYDGMTGVIEAEVNGRYRYVARHSGEFNADQIRRMADAFLALAKKRTPGFRPIHPC